MYKQIRMNKLFILVFIFFFLFFLGNVSYAHPGNVSYDGCHYCWTNCSYWGFTYGTRHNRDNPANTCACDANLGPKDPLYCTPQVIAPITDELSTFINSKGTTEFSFLSDGSTSVKFSFTDTAPTQYSLALSRYRGEDPGPLADTSSTTYTFTNAQEGQEYINVKKLINGYWSGVYTWDVNVPAWSQPTDTPTPTIEPSTQSNPNNNLTLAAIFGFSAIGVAGYYIGKQNKN